jgi:hypothetical protein
VYAVAPGQSSGDNYQVARLLHPLLTHVFRHDSHGAAEYQRVGNISVIEADGSVDRRYAHSIAVVRYSGAHAFEYAPRVQHALRQLVV